MPKTTTVRTKSKSIASSAKKPIAAITTTEPSPRATRELRIGLVGYGFMGRAHANAIHQVAHFFNKGTAGNDRRRPVLQAVCGRDEAKLREFAATWDARSVETDWRAISAQPSISEDAGQQTHRQSNLIRRPSRNSEALRKVPRF